MKKPAYAFIDASNLFYGSAVVIPVKTGIYGNFSLDSRLRGNDWEDAKIL